MTAGERSSLARRAAILVGPIIAVAVIVLVVRQIALDWRRLPAEAHAAFHVAGAPLVAAWCAQTVGWLLAVDTWRRILSGLDRDLPFAHHMQLYAYSSLTQVVPGSVWVPASRVVAYRQAGASGLAVTTAMAIEWFIVGVAGLLLFGATVPLQSVRAGPTWLPLVGMVLLGFALVQPSVFSRAAGAASRAVGRPTTLPALRRGDLVAWTIREIGVVGLSGASLYLLMRGVAPQADLVAAVNAVAITTALGVWLTWMPLTGVLRAGLMALLLGPVYGSSVVALGVVVVWRVWSLLVAVTWALLAALCAGRVRLPQAGRGSDEPRDDS